MSKIKWSRVAKNDKISLMKESIYFPPVNLEKAVAILAAQAKQIEKEVQSIARKIALQVLPTHREALLITASAK